MHNIKLLFNILNFRFSLNCNSCLLMSHNSTIIYIKNHSLIMIHL